MKSQNKKVFENKFILYLPKLLNLLTVAEEQNLKIRILTRPNKSGRLRPLKNGGGARRDTSHTLFIDKKELFHLIFPDKIQSKRNFFEK